MDKRTFLLNLRQALSVLQEEELQDIVSEYEQHIDMKVENGLTEEEAIADFGSMTELTAEILEAYHVRADYAASPSGRQRKAENGYRKGASQVADLSEGNIGAETAEKLKKNVKNLGTALLTGFSAVGAAVKNVVLWGKKQVRRPFLWIWRLWKNRGDTEEKQGYWKRSRKRRRDKMVRVMERRGYGDTWQEKEDDTAKTGVGIFSMIGEGIRRVFRGCVDAVKWCIRLGWNICCIGASLLVGFFGLFCLYGLGVLVVLLLQGYPLLGLTLGCLGLVLCMFSLACFGFTLRWFPDGAKDVRMKAEGDREEQKKKLGRQRIVRRTAREEVRLEEVKGKEADVEDIGQIGIGQIDIGQTGIEQAGLNQEGLERDELKREELKREESEDGSEQEELERRAEGAEEQLDMEDGQHA